MEHGPQTSRRHFVSAADSHNEILVKCWGVCFSLTTVETCPNYVIICSCLFQSPHLTLSISGQNPEMTYMLIDTRIT